MHKAVRLNFRMTVIGVATLSITAAHAESLRIGIDEAVRMGLSNNRSLLVERYEPDIRRVRAERARARFDTDIAAEVSTGRETATPRTADGAEISADWNKLQLGLSRELPSGSRLAAEAALGRTETEGDDLHTLRVGVSVTQALLQGAGVSVNRIDIRQADLDTRSSWHELTGFTEALVARIETTYWDTVLAVRGIDIVRESAQLAEQQLRDVEKRINAGALAPTERAAANAESALRQGELIRAQGNLDRVRLALLRLLNPPGDRPWDQAPDPVDEPPSVMALVDAVEEHVALALRLRPDLSQARLALARGDLEVARTRNGLLPRLDLFIRLGRTGYANSFSGALDGLGDNDPDFSAGLQWTQALGRGAARMRHRESEILRRQAEAAVANMEQLVELDVRTAHIEVERTDKQVTAAAATRAAQEEKWRAEMEKFQVGRSTALFVAQVQRDLMVARLAEVEAVINTLKARIDLFRLDGSLLQRRGIAVSN